MHQHQPRERTVPCTDCRRPTMNTHAVCNGCLDQGHPVACFTVCEEVIRSEQARFPYGLPV